MRRKRAFSSVLEFQRAVVSRVEPILASGKAVVTVTISKEMASHRTLKDIEKLAIEGFKECHKEFICLHAEPGSIIISWVFPKGLSDRLEQLARDNAAIFEENGVSEVTVGGRRVFPCTKQEVRINTVYCLIMMSLIFAAECYALTRSVSAGSYTCNCITIIAKTKS